MHHLSDILRTLLQKTAAPNPKLAVGRRMTSSCSGRSCGLVPSPSPVYNTSTSTSPVDRSRGAYNILRKPTPTPTPAVINRGNESLGQGVNTDYGDQSPQGSLAAMKNESLRKLSTPVRVGNISVPRDTWNKMSRAERAELTRKVGENYGVFKQQNQGAAPSQNPYGVMKHKPTAREWADAGKINGKLITLPDGRRVYDRY